MNNPPALFMVQAMWGMREFPTLENEWSIEKKLESIKEAGFDAIDLDIPLVQGKENYWRALLQKHGLGLGLQGPLVHNVIELEKCISTVQEMNSLYLDVQVGNYFISESEGIEILRSLVNRAQGEINLCVQTHRGRITQDLFKTVRYCQEIPNLRLNLDLSHYFVAGELGSEALPKEAEEAFEVLLKSTSMIDGRVSNGQQVQIDIGPEGESPFAQNFYKLWKKAIKFWLERAKPGETFIFRPELGPPNYSIVNLDGHEISDRWAQAQLLARIGRRLWNEALTHGPLVTLVFDSVGDPSAGDGF